MNKRITPQALQSLKTDVLLSIVGAGFDTQALIEGAKAITETLDLGSDERPNQVVRLLNKAQENVQKLQDLLDSIDSTLDASIAASAEQA